ncbi:MAG: hypothetical protein N4A45_01860 [Flavobacteriales bacterium]|jgi:tetratricopeptide (TPR) repeat protein|nr:hypothetical protein [Flavobacteriales bacterium]
MMRNNKDERFNQRLSLEQIASIEYMLESKKVNYYDSEVFIEMIDYLVEKNRLSSALIICEIALSIHPDAPKILLEKAKVLFDNYEIEASNELVDKIETLLPNSSDLFQLKANLSLKMGKNQEALDFLLKAAENAELPESFYSQISNEYRRLGEIESAIDYLEKYCVTFPEDEFCVSLLYDYYIDYEDSSRGVSFFNSLTSELPFSYIIWYYNGLLLKNEGDYIKAFSAFEYAYFINEMFIPAYHEIINILFLQNQYNEAKEFLLKVSLLEEPSAITFSKLSQCYREIGGLSSAILYGEKAVTEDPQLAFAWEQLALAFLEKENYSESFFAFQKALRMDYENSSYRLQFAKICEKNDEWKMAKDMYLEIIQEEGLEDHLVLSLLECYLHLGENERGKMISEKAKLASENALFHCFSAYFNYYCQNEEYAKELFLLACEKDNTCLNKMQSIAPNFVQVIQQQLGR